MATKKTPAKKKPTKKVDPNKAHRDWLLKQDLDSFMELTRAWCESSLNLKLPELNSFDDALNYFKTIPFAKLGQIARTGDTALPTEAYSALLLWREIVGSPTKISKFHKSGLVSSSGAKSIVEVAEEDNMLETLKAIRRKVAEKIDSGSDDMARLTEQLRDITHQIDAERRRLGPKEDTELGKMIKQYKRRAKYNGGGADNTSFKSRMIDDVENEK